MSFEIHNAAGQGILLKDLDKEANDFWNTGAPLGNSRYASPVKYAEGKYNNDIEYTRKVMLLNWYDIIGRTIHISRADTWEAVESKILEPWLKTFEPEKIMESSDFYEDVHAYLNLIAHWKVKGYKPVYVNDL